jgi:hypothetical protein
MAVEISLSLVGAALWMADDEIRTGEELPE